MAKFEGKPTWRTIVARPSAWPRKAAGSITPYVPGQRPAEGPGVPMTRQERRTIESRVEAAA